MAGEHYTTIYIYQKEREMIKGDVRKIRKRGIKRRKNYAHNEKEKGKEKMNTGK